MNAQPQTAPLEGTIEDGGAPRPQMMMVPIGDGAVAIQQVPPMMALIERLVTTGAGVDVVERLIAVQERLEQNAARRAFANALSRAKAEIPVIKKNRHVGFASKKPGATSTDYWHEDLAEIVSTITPILGKYGLSHRFRTTSKVNEPVVVTCIISHADGYEEENTLSAGADNSGNKNSIQAIGSTVTFLERYTLKASLGLAASKDDDGAKADEEREEFISEEQIDILIRLMEQASKLLTDPTKAAGDLAMFCNFLKVPGLADIPAKRFQEAKDAIEGAIETRTAKRAEAAKGGAK